MSRRHIKRQGRQHEEGAALFIVLMIILAGTASAVFAVNTAAIEMRGTGSARQQTQARYAAEAGLFAALDWLDVFGPETVRELVQNSAYDDGTTFANDYPEVRMAPGKKLYRLYAEHFEALLSPDGVTPGLLANAPVEKNSSFGSGSVQIPMVTVDIYDERVVSKLAPGAAAQGGTKFKYLHATLTSRGRARVDTNGDGVIDASDDYQDVDDLRPFNESGADMRAYIVSGPFSTGI